MGAGVKFESEAGGNITVEVATLTMFEVVVAATLPPNVKVPPFKVVVSAKESGKPARKPGAGAGPGALKFCAMTHGLPVPQGPAGTLIAKLCGPANVTAHQNGSTVEPNAVLLIAPVLLRSPARI